MLTDSTTNVSAMRTSAGIAVSAALILALTGCGSQATPAAPAPHHKLTAPLQNDGPHPTIADYLRDHKIIEARVHRDDDGTPKIDLPTPDGWKSAGDDTPAWAYDAIVYTGPGADADHPPSVVALLSELTGAVDPKALLAVAPGELQNLPGFTASGPGVSGTLGGYPAYRSSGTWTTHGQHRFVAQQTVIISAKGKTYVLQLNSDGTAEQAKAVQSATDAVDQRTKITP